MARIRTIKPEFWSDEKLSPMDDTTRLVFLGLISMADDCGRLLDSAKQIEAYIWPHADRSRGVREALANLSRAGRIVRGVTESGQNIIEVTNWKKHQKVDHPNTRAALPKIVTQVVEPADDTQPFAKASRKPRERFANGSRGARDTIYDLRPTTNDLPRKTEELDRTTADADAPPSASGDGKPGGWPAELAARWRTRIGDTTEGRIGKALKGCVSTYGIEAISKAFDAYADEPMGHRTKTPNDFASGIVRWIREAAQPLVDEHGVMTERGERVTRPPR